MIGVKQLLALVSSAVVFAGGVLMHAGDGSVGVALTVTPTGATSLLADAPVPLTLEGLHVIEVRVPADLLVPPARIEGAIAEMVLVASTTHGASQATLGAETLRIPPGALVRVTDLTGVVTVEDGDLATLVGIDGVARGLTVGAPFGSPVSTTISDERGIPVRSLSIDGIAVRGVHRDAGTFRAVDARLLSPEGGDVPDLGLGGDVLPIDHETHVSFEDFVGVIVTIAADGDELRLGLEGYANVTVGEQRIEHRVHEERSVDLPGAANEAPVAAFTFRPTTPSVKERVEFIDESLDDLFVNEWHWDLGDGAASTQPHPSHAYDAAGVYTVTLSVWDAQGEMSTAEHVVRVTPTPPEVHLERVPRLPVELELVRLTADVEDPEGDVESIEWRFSDGLTFTGDAVERSFSRGEYDLSVVATDATGTRGWANDSFSIGNAPPVASFEVLPAGPLAGQPVVLSSTSQDAGAGRVTDVRWQVEGVQGTLTGESVDAVFPKDGAIDVTITATDDEGARSTVTRPVTVLNPPPVVTIRTIPALPNPGRAVSLVAEVRDDDRPQGAVWTLPGGVTRSGLVASFTFPAGGLYDVALTVTDPDGASGSTTRSVRVNHPPVAEILTSAPVVHTGEASAFTGRADDADGDALTYAWALDGRPAGTSTTFAKTWTDDGNHTLRLTVTDTNGAVGHASAAAVVLNRPPTVDPRAEGGVVNLNHGVTLVAGARDVDGRVTAVRWFQGETLLGTGENLVTTFRTAGLAALAVVATDDDGAKTRVPFTVTVNAPPLVTASVGPLDVDAGRPVTLDASATDPEGHAIQFLWELGDGATAGDASLEHVYALEGTYRPKLTVTDSAGGRIVRTWTIHVATPELPIELDLSPDAPKAGEEFTVRLELPEGRDVEEITWDLGDGSEPVVTGQGVTRLRATYADPRTFTLSAHVLADYSSEADVATDVRVVGATAHAVRIEPLLPDGQCVNVASPNVVARATNLVTGHVVDLREGSALWTVEGACTLLTTFPRGTWSVGDGLDLVLAVGGGTTLRLVDYEVDGDLRLLDLVLDAAELTLGDLALESAGGASGTTFADPTEAVYATGVLAWADGTPARTYEISFRVAYRGPLSPDTEGIEYADWTRETGQDGTFRVLVPAPLLGASTAAQNDPSATSFVYAPGQYSLVAQATSGVMTSTSAALFAEDPLGILATLRGGGIIG